MLSFAGMLFAPPTEAMQPAAQRKAYNKNKVQPKWAGSMGRYRLCLEGQQKTVSEIAEYMGYTYGGAHASMYRLRRQGRVKVVGLEPSHHGRPRKLYTWVNIDG